jgi:hypothetical protein
MRNATFFVLAGLVLGGAAAAEPERSAPPAVAAAAESAQPAKPREAVICKYLEPATGSHIGQRRVCKTRQEWRELSSNSRDIVDSVMRRSMLNNCIPTKTGCAQ